MNKLAWPCVYCGGDIHSPPCGTAWHRDIDPATWLDDLDEPDEDA